MTIASHTYDVYNNWYFSTIFYYNKLNYSEYNFSNRF